MPTLFQHSTQKTSGGRAGMDGREGQTSRQVHRAIQEMRYAILLLVHLLLFLESLWVHFHRQFIFGGVISFISPRCHAGLPTVQFIPSTRVFYSPHKMKPVTQQILGEIDRVCTHVDPKDQSTTRQNNVVLHALSNNGPLSFTLTH